MDYNIIKEKMNKSIDNLREKFAEVRAGRANPAILNKDLKVMDSTATALCKDNNIPLVVFGIADPENIVRAVKGEKIGTTVK